MICAFQTQISYFTKVFFVFCSAMEYVLIVNWSVFAMILFFETEDNQVFAHTKKDVYQTKYRLYELEELLPGSFIRVSKSTILNVSHVLSIKKNLTASSEVWFEGTHKQVYVSRNYYKQLKQRLEEKRLKR